MKVYASIELHLAYHIDSTTLADGNYQLIPEPEGGCSEDSGNFVTEYRKPQTKVRKILTFLTSDPPVKASPVHNLLFLLHCNLYLFTYYMH
jgi:hypothetical protein